MIKETITFEDIDGNEASQNAYFHASKRDLVRLTGSDAMTTLQQLSGNNGEELSTNAAANKLFDLVTEFVRISYGKRVTDPDGSNPRFVKNAQETEDFINSDIGGDFIFDLAADQSRLFKFIQALFPKGTFNEAVSVITDAKNKTVDAEGNETVDVNGTSLQVTPELLALLKAQVAPSNIATNATAEVTPKAITE